MIQTKTILVTGGLGYIGSHTVVELINSGFNVIILDNLSNSKKIILDRIEQITNVRPIFYKKNACNLKDILTIFSVHEIDVVIHFAAFKSVGESVKQPLLYFQNNLISLLNILQGMQTCNVKNIVFSSSATVYGEPDILPITEQTPFKKAKSAYGSTKQMGEEILDKISETGTINSISLRYFNPVGAHDSSLIGELPIGTPNNLFPYLTQTAVGKLPLLTVFGDDFNTNDGSCIRDYIHVVDLAKAHVAACKRLVLNQYSQSAEVFNIGTGKGTSVLEVINEFKNITGEKVNYTIGPRREGDAASVYSDNEKAKVTLNWSAKLTLKDMIKSAWAWQKSL